MQKFNLVFLPDSNYSEIIIQKFEEVAPSVNVYVCISNDNKYLKNERVVFINIRHFSSYEGDFRFLEKKFGKIIFNLNSLLTTNFYYKYIYNNKNFADATKIMMFWSGELYSHPAYKAEIYDSHSLKYKKSLKKLYASKMMDYFLNILKLPSYGEYYRLNKEMDFFCGFFESEHLIYNSVFQSRSRYIPFTFLDLSLMKFPENTSESLKKDILIGNSGSLENNHSEIFQILQDIDPIEYNNLIVPLSYGKTSYIESIIHLGFKHFGNKYQPITEFLKREDYNNKLQSVKVAIFNHYIQQAVGNILFMLYIGSRVYLNKKNPLYKGFLDKGFIVNSLDEMSKYGLTPLSNHEQQINRNLIIKFINVDKSRSYYQSIIEV